jgi:hypothetical protein
LLYLASQKAVKWRVRAEGGARLKQIIISGSKQQRLEGVVEAFRVRRIANGMPLAIAWEHERDREKHFPDFINSVHESTHLRENSFQGCYRGKAFRVPLKP